MKMNSIKNTLPSFPSSPILALSSSSEQHARQILKEVERACEHMHHLDWDLRRTNAPPRTPRKSVKNIVNSNKVAASSEIYLFHPASYVYVGTYM